MIPFYIYLAQKLTSSFTIENMLGFIFLCTGCVCLNTLGHKRTRTHRRSHTYTRTHIHAHMYMHALIYFIYTFFLRGVTIRKCAVTLLNHSPNSITSNAACQNICVSIHRLSPDTFRYLKKKLSLSTSIHIHQQLVNRKGNFNTISL